MADRKKDDDYEEEEIEMGEAGQGLVEFNSTAMPKSEGPIATVSENETFFDIVPMRKNCKFCSVQIVTYVEKEVHPLFGLAAIFTVFIFGLLSFFLLPMLYFLTKNVVHRCSRCLQKLGEKQCYGMPDDLSAPVWEFRLGKCSIVTTRIYAIIGLILMTIGCGGYIYMRPSWDLNTNPLFHHNLESHPISANWENYLKDCGGSSVIENQVHAKMQFNKIYENNVINWTGVFAEVKAKQKGFVLFGTEHHLSILIKMQPSESDKFADLVLSISTTIYEKEKAFYDSLVKGDELDF